MPVSLLGSTFAVAAASAAVVVEVEFALALVREKEVAVWFEEVELVASFSAAVAVVADGHLI